MRSSTAVLTGVCTIHPQGLQTGLSPIKTVANTVATSVRTPVVTNDGATLVKHKGSDDFVTTLILFFVLVYRNEQGENNR